MKRKTLIIDGILLILVFCFITGIQAYWLGRNTSFLPADMDIHLGKVHNYYNAITEGYPLNSVLERRPREYPPLLYITGAVAYGIFGPSEKAACLSITIFSLLLILAVYGMGLSLGGRWLAWISVLLAISSPEWFINGITFRHEAPLTAFLALCFLFYFRSEGFRNRKDSILCGVFAGLAASSKFSFLFFLVFPFIFWIINIWITGEGKGKDYARRTAITAGGFLVLALIVLATRLMGDRFIMDHLLAVLIIWIVFMAGMALGAYRLEKNLKFSGALKQKFNLFYALLAAVLLGLPHYAVNMGEFKAKLATNMMTGANIAGTDIPNMIWYYLSELNRFFPLALVFLGAGIIISFMPGYKDKRNEIISLILSITGGVLFLSVLAAIKHPHYIIPALPAVILISTFWMTRLKYGFRNAIFALVVILFLWQSTGWFWQYKSPQTCPKIPAATAPLPQNFRVEPYPENSDFPLEKDLLEAIRKDNPIAINIDTVRLLVKRPFESPLDPPYMRYLADIKDYFSLSLIFSFSQEIQREDLAGWDYMILVVPGKNLEKKELFESLIAKKTGSPPVIVKEIKTRYRGVTYMNYLYRYPVEQDYRKSPDRPLVE